MKIQDKYRDEFLREKEEGQIPNYRFSHGQQVYESACVECLERLQKLNTDRLNYMLQKENVCAFILVLGLSKHLKYREFFEFLSYVYDDGKENDLRSEKNLEMIIKFFISGYDNLVLQRQTNLNVEQLQESDESLLLEYLEQIKNEENPIGKMQEIVSKHIKENIILGFSDDEILDLSFLGLFRLSEEEAQQISSKKKRKTRVFLLSLPFVLFYIHQKRIFDLNATYAQLILYNKQFNKLNQNGSDSQGGKGEESNNRFNEGDNDQNLDNFLLQDDKIMIKAKMEKSVLFKSLEAKTSQQLNNLKNQQVSQKGKKKTLQTPAMGGVANNQQSNSNQLICGNTGKAPAFINALHQDYKMREPSLAAGILPVQQKDPAENLANETLVHINDCEKKNQQSDFVLNIMKDPYDYFEDEGLVSEEDNPKGLLLEMAIKHFKTHSCLQFKSTLINQKEFECVLLFQDSSIYTRGRAVNKKGCEKLASAKMVPLLKEYIQEKEQINNKPKKLILFSTHTNQTIKKTDKINNDLKNHHPQLQKMIENNLYHANSNNSSSSTSSNGNNYNQQQKSSKQAIKEKKKKNINGEQYFNQTQMQYSQMPDDSSINQQMYNQPVGNQLINYYNQQQLQQLFLQQQQQQQQYMPNNHPILQGKANSVTYSRPSPMEQNMNRTTSNQQEYIQYPVHQTAQIQKQFQR